MDEAEVLYYHAKLQQENEVPTRNIMEMFSCLYGLQNKMHIFRKYILSFTISKIREKMYLPTTLPAKLKPFHVDIIVTVLM